MLVEDQMGRKVDVPNRPKRIISLVPSQTELLYDLGLEQEVVGITKFCIHPQHWHQEKERVGGTKDFHLDKIQALEPDLIIGNKEENEKELIESLAENYPVWMSDISDLDDALDMIELIGQLTQREKEAEGIVVEILSGFDALKTRQKGSAIYLIWKNPFMSVGTDTFIDDMLGKAGFDNLIKEARYPELSLDTIKKATPDHLLLSSEPFPFKEKHVEELSAELPNTKISIVDGEMFSWYGSRLVKSASYFSTL